MKIRAVLIRTHGGPEVLTVDEIDLSPPAVGEAQIRHTAIGLNFIDVYHRTGLYTLPGGLPLIPGNEAAGVVTALGAGVTSLKVGDRVAYAAAIGAYCEARNIAADRLVRIPDGVADVTAAAMMLKGMTAEFLLCRTFPVQKGQTILFHAAAGGVGSIAGQWANAIGATVIGTAGSPEKAAQALANGYHHVIEYRREDCAARVKEITGGNGVDAVYDSVGRDTWLASLDSLKSRGMFVCFGQSSGPIEGFTLAHLAARGSLYATRPSLFAYTASRADLELSAGRLFDMVASGKVKIAVNQTVPLANVAEAHRMLESRATTGATVLIP
jgi:NADPH:quinone reductase